MPDPYFSELKFLGTGTADFIEVAVDTGTDVSNIQFVVYNPDGTVRTTNDLGAIDSTNAGKDVYSIDAASSPTFNGIHKNGAVALVVDGTVVSFLSFENTVTPTEGPATGDSEPLGATGAGESFESTDGGGSYQVQSTPTSGTIPCFLRGTLIATPDGERPVEELRAGDLVLTDDAGPQPILWAGQRALALADYADPGLRPIRVPTGSFGAGLPLRDLHLSPNHRVAITHPACALYFQQREVLVPVKALVGYRGIGAGPVALPICFHHLLLEQHHIIRAQGLACETFLPDAIGLDGFGAVAVAEISRACPRLVVDPRSYGPSARMILKPLEAQLVLDMAGEEDLIDTTAKARRRIRSRAKFA